MGTRIVTTLLAFAPFALAQNTVISPTLAATQGGVGNIFPWLTPGMRYMQVHSDLKGTPRSFHQISFRMPPGNQTFTAIRTNDLELVMSESVDYDEVTPPFAANFVGTPRTVFTRKLISFGPQGTQGIPVSPFVGMSIPFDTPFPYGGVHSVAWDARLHAGDFPPKFACCDLLASPSSIGFGTNSGIGCQVGGQLYTMQLYADTYQAGHHLIVLLNIRSAPINAATVLAIGATNPAWTVPGICGTIYTDLLLTHPIGTTNAYGDIPVRSASSALFLKTNPAPGSTVHLQAHTVDLASTWSTPIANSDGIRLRLPSLAPPLAIEVTRLYVAGPANTAVAFVDPQTMIGHGLVTQFHF